MLLFLPVLILVLSVGGLAAAQRLRSEPRMYWRIGAASSALAWLSLLFLRGRLPLGISTSYWRPAAGEFFDIGWVLDAGAWPFAFVISTLLLAFHLVEVQRFAQSKAMFWAPVLVIGAACLFAIFSADLLAMALSFTILDVLVLAEALLQKRDEAETRAHMGEFLIKVLGSTILVWVYVAQPDPGGMELASIPAATQLMILLAAGLRLGVLPLGSRATHGSSEGNHTPVLLGLIQVVPTFVLLGRLQSALPAYQDVFLGVVLLLAIRPAVNWVIAPDRGLGLLDWASGFSALALAAAGLGHSQAVLAWGLGLPLGGALLSFAGGQRSLRWPLLALGALLFGGLPFTPGNPGNVFYSGQNSVLAYLFLFPHSLLVLGWLRRALRRARDLSRERWVDVIYLSGVFLLPAIHLLMGLGLAPGLEFATMSGLFWAPLALLGLVGVFGFGARDLAGQFSGPMARLQTILSFEWAYRLALGFLVGLARLMRVFSGLLEGRAGLLWALLVVALLLSLISQLTLAG